MLHLITGGSGSGKSAYAEKMICGYHELQQQGELIYIATMFPHGEETKDKIARHRRMRAGKQFQTKECYTNLKALVPGLIQHYPQASVLLECISNLTANELYLQEGAKEQTINAVIGGVAALQQAFAHVVVVTNELCSEVPVQGEEMDYYKRTIGAINCALAARAERVTEVVYGIPIAVKG